MSVDNQVDAEWTTAADGPHKRQRASELAARLKRSGRRRGWSTAARAGGIPGEPLPRWQIGLYWRADGQAAVARRDAAGRPLGRRRRPARRRTDAAAYELLAAIADDLGLPLSQVRPAYEDPLSRLAAKARLPDG